MRKSRTARLLALVMGVWLSLVQSDAGLFHACSTGNGAVAAYEASDVASTPPSHGAHGEHAEHGNHQAPAAAADTSPTHQHGTGDAECHCIGHCCVSTVPALRAPDTFALVSVVHVDAVQPGRASHAVVAEWADFVLPFATAPPVVIVG
ncbi:hypothetical protein [Gemmatimonas sp.]|uniref:hypothetical protein n=1 Tax=Gemmatimonas sp. TaxID=1962908 RepID=UPI003DA4FAEF